MVTMHNKTCCEKVKPCKQGWRSVIWQKKVLEDLMLIPMNEPQKSVSKRQTTWLKIREGYGLEKKFGKMQGLWMYLRGRVPA